MTSARRAEARRRARLEARDELPPTTLVAGWAREPDDVAQTRATTGKAVEEALGDRRRSDVGWRELEGFVALQAVDVLRAQTTDAELLAFYAEVRAKLLTIGGILVIASAAGMP